MVGVLLTELILVKHLVCARCPARPKAHIKCYYCPLEEHGQMGKRETCKQTLQ